MAALPKHDETPPYRLPVAWPAGLSPFDGRSANESIDRAPASDDTPDRRYWTAYDHFMVEREARAMRNAYIAELVARGWRRVKAHLRMRRPDGR